MRFHVTPAGLLAPAACNFWENRRLRRTVTVPGRGRTLITIDDSGTVMQIESGERLDAIVRPKTIRYRIRHHGPAGSR